MFTIFFQIGKNEVSQIETNLLDDTIIFRFSHICRNPFSGGMETYLYELNQKLLERNRMQILQMYLSPTGGPDKIEIEKVGRGELIWIPSFYTGSLIQQTTWAMRFWHKLRNMSVTRLTINHDMLLSTLAHYQINLAVFHWISEDSKIVINYLKNRRIQFVVINHFQNTRLKRDYIRTQISGVQAIGGVSNIAVPDFVKSRFTNLSDGINVDFFSLEKAVPLEKKSIEPLIFLPSRITEEKGHLDAVRAVGYLARSGVSAILVFAGRQESQTFMKKLTRVISEEGIKECDFCW